MKSIDKSEPCEVDPNQMWFPFFAEVEAPTLVPVKALAEFRSETDAVEWSIRQHLQRRPGKTLMSLASELRWPRAVMTKLRQGQVAMPRGDMQKFIEATACYGYLQYWCMRVGLVVRTVEQAREERERVARLESEIDQLRLQVAAYKRAVGE